jgi:hypothetical protein
MSRFIGISLMVLGLALAAYDGFRDRERVRPTVTNAENETVHSNDFQVLPPR